MVEGKRGRRENPNKERAETGTPRGGKGWGRRDGAYRGWEGREEGEGVGKERLCIQWREDTSIGEAEEATGKAPQI